MQLLGKLSKKLLICAADIELLLSKTVLSITSLLLNVAALAVCGCKVNTHPKTAKNNITAYFFFIVILPHPS
ncbi:MAG TPA: hypothetical protein VIJ68_04015, partial [Candidatus Saccharimonadales bacterium]